MKRIGPFLLAALTAVVLSACNTMAGAGKDISAAGETIQGAAKKK